MVNDGNSWLASHGYSAKVILAGGHDIEPNWATYARTVKWVDGFDQYTSYRMYDYGGAAGCPWFGAGGTTCDNGWTQERERYVSWGATSSFPLPEIYRTDGISAEQWVLISKWGIDNSLSKIVFQGPLSQHGACTQVSCTSGLNTPIDAWSDMVTKMDAKPATIAYMTYSTDICWRYLYSECPIG